MTRLPKVNSLLQKEVAEIVRTHVEFENEVLVTISEVETSSNVSNAKVFVSVVPKSQEKEVLLQLKEDIYHIQKELNKKLSSMRVPKIRFVIDHREEHAAHIEELIDQEHRRNESGSDRTE